MDVIGASRKRVGDEKKSPERVKFYVQPKMNHHPFRKVQVLYYLCRNGQLEHPHFMEVTHLSTQHLRLKDVIDRLIVLRGKNMPSLYSWSCKRCYKNGYVWNDLGENDIIYPAEGAEYILKGSELIEDCSEKFQQIQLKPNKQQNPEPIFQSKRRLLVKPHHHHHHEQREPEPELEEDEEEEEEEEEESESNKSTSSNKSSSRCSKGVSTDHEDLKPPKNPESEITLEIDSSSPSISSTHSGKVLPQPINTNNSERFNDEHDSVVTELKIMNRSSALFQLIACGSSAAIRERNNNNNNVPCSGRKSNGSSTSNVSLHKGVLCKTALMKKMMSEEEEDDINYMPENPRFGNPQSEEKEYFSGSIVESITEVDRVQLTTQPSLKKSSSYNEERSIKSGLEEVMIEKKVDEKKKKVKGKCIPRRKVISSFKQTKK